MTEFFTYHFEGDTFPGQPLDLDWSLVKTGSDNGILFCEFPNGLRIEFITVDAGSNRYRIAMFTSRRIEGDSSKPCLGPDDDSDDNEYFW